MSFFDKIKDVTSANGCEQFGGAENARVDNVGVDKSAR